MTKIYVHNEFKNYVFIEYSQNLCLSDAVFERDFLSNLYNSLNKNVIYFFHVKKNTIVQEKKFLDFAAESERIFANKIEEIVDIGLDNTHKVLYKSYIYSVRDILLKRVHMDSIPEAETRYQYKFKSDFLLLSSHSNKFDHHE